MNKKLLVSAVLLLIITAVLSITVSPYFLALLFLYAPVGVIFTEISKFDERERFIRYRSGYLALQLSIFLFVFLFIQRALVTGRNPEVIYYLMLSFPTIVYVFFLFSQSIDLARSGRIILYIFGGFWIVFSILSHGFTPESLIESPIGIGFFIPALLSYKYRKFAGIISFIYATFLLLIMIRSFTEPVFSTTLLVIIPAPLYYAGAVFFHREEKEK